MLPTSRRRKPVLPVWLANSVVAAAFTIALVRLGLLAAVVSHLSFFLTLFQIAPDPGTWFFPISCTMIGLTLVFAGYRFFTSVGARNEWLSEDSLRMALPHGLCARSLQGREKEGATRWIYGTN